MASQRLMLGPLVADVSGVFRHFTPRPFIRLSYCRWPPPRLRHSPYAPFIPLTRTCPASYDVPILTEVNGALSNIGFIRQSAQAAARRYPWYAELLRECADGSLPPLLTAPLLERHLYDQPLDAPPDDSLFVYRTSGTSSGIRKTIAYSEADEQRYIDIKAKMFQAWLLEESGGTDGSGYGRRLDAPIRTVLIDMGTGHAAATAMDVFARLGLDAQSLPFTLPIEQHLERIEAFRPDLLYTMPSILERIVQRAPHSQSLGIRKVILVGEVASPSWQRHIAGRLGIAPDDLLDTYGSIEIGTIAAYSRKLGRYVLAEGLYAEGVPAESLGEGFDPLAPDERVLVLTSSVRDAFPAVRYVTYDVVRDLRTDRVDGTRRQTFAGIVKRIGPELKHGEKISLYDIEEAVLAHVDDASIRVTVQGRRLKVRVASRRRSEALSEADIRQAIESRVPEIGTMIRGGLLERIEVTLADGNGEDAKGAAGGGIKARKIHYETPETP